MRFLYTSKRLLGKYVRPLLAVGRSDLPSKISDTTGQIVRQIHLTKQETSCAYFIFYRVLFDICYCCRKDLYPPTNSSLIAKIIALSNVHVSLFPFAKSLLSIDFEVNLSMRDYVRNEERFATCCELFLKATFMSNPLDVLFYVYLVLREIKQSGLGLKKQEESLSFDDTFSIFLMVFLGSDVVDVFGLCAFVKDLAPKRLHSEFEYSRMMLESLASHCSWIDLDNMSDVLP